MDEHRDELPRPSDFPRLADAYSGDGFPVHGPWTELSAAVLADALEALKESRSRDRLVIKFEACPHCEADERAAIARAVEEAKAQTRAAKEIEAAWNDPHWLDGH